MYVTDSIRTLKGVGDKVEQNLNKLGIFTIEDLIEYYPRTYQMFPEPVELSEMMEGKKMAIHGWLKKSLTQVPGGKVNKTVGYLEEGNLRLQLLWYRMPYIKKQVFMGKNYIFYGRIHRKNSTWIMEQPEVYEADAYRKLQENIQPVYSLTEGVHQKLLVRLMEQVVNDQVLFEDYLPKEISENLNLPEYNFSIQNIHFPKNWEILKQCRRRLGFDEFFLFALGIRRMKGHREKLENIHRYPTHEWADMFISQLPYVLTQGQLNAWNEIIQDFQGPILMNRLLQGDVGSGKTIVAQLALITAVEHGEQGCLMVPTEVLAQQHFESFEKEFAVFEKRKGIAIRCALLTGSTKAKDKKQIYEDLKNHKIDVVIGTHAVIQDKVVFDNLGLVITDEQHRFGVHQREWLSKKGQTPHVFVMSATPIPRTLAIILYGDLDISVINELPAKRKPIKNCVVDTGYRPAAYRFIEKEVQLGHQVYVICPMVEESEWVDLENVMDYSGRLQSALSSSIRVAFLHGKMSSVEKEEIMKRFYERQIDVLVSTTVIEVGINVPNATVMMVENAERFGLAQLHQLRGRVGRGDAQSYCIFVQSGKSQSAKERLEILVKSNDGFFIASEDLKLRGPGDMFGLKQSGLLDFQIADLYQDGDLLKEAGNYAEIFETKLNEPLERKMKRYMKVNTDGIIL